MAAVRLLFRPRPIVRASRHCTLRYSTTVEPECELKNLDNEATGTSSLHTVAMLNALC